MTCKEIVNSIDWSATSDLFKLASYVLKDEFKDAANSMVAIGDNSKIIDKAAYRDWPIFKEFVKTNDFAVAYKDVFKVTEENNNTVSKV